MLAVMVCSMRSVFAGVLLTVAAVGANAASGPFALHAEHDSRPGPSGLTVNSRVAPEGQRVRCVDGRDAMTSDWEGVAAGYV